MTDLDLEVIRKRAAAATPGPVSYDHPLHDLCVGGDHIQKEDPWYTICDENGDRLATVDTKPVAEFLTEAFTDVPALCDEVDRLTKDRDAQRDRIRSAAHALIETIGADGPEDLEQTAKRASDEIVRLRGVVAHWKANHDEQVRRNYALTHRTDLDVGKVRDRVELVQRYDALVAENAKLREGISAFIKKYDECDPYITSAFFMAYTNRGSQYTGPTFKDELRALRSLADLALRGGA